MTIIIVNDYDYVQGGATKVAIETANLLYNKGYNIIFFCGVSDKDKSSLNNKIRVVSCNKYDCLSQKNVRGILQGIDNHSANRKFKDLLNEIDDEILIHIHGWTKCLSTSFIRSIKRIKKKKKIKVVLTLHDFFTICPNGGLFNYQTNNICKLKPMSLHCLLCNCDSRNYFYKLYRYLRTFFQNDIYRFRKKIDAVIFISNLQKRILEPYFVKKPAYFVYNPTLINVKEPVRTKAELNNEYLFVGRLTKDKGIDILCETFSKTKFILNVVGAGPLDNQLKCKYRNYPNIIFHGWQNQKNVYHFYSTCRALFIPSVYYEGAPLAIFEGLSFGIPCVVSNLCAGIDFISDKRHTGISFNPYSQNETISLLTEMCNNDYIKEISTRSFENYWKDPFDEKKYIASLLNVYSKIIGNTEEK